MARITGTKRSETLNGSNANDEIFGLEGNDTLSGLGGTDSLYGGLGNDIYVVDNIGDKVIEKANEGTDLVQASVSYTLANNVENLTLTGTKAINATGNSVANILIGNVGNNVLDGKAGADKMNGGKGNDTYIIDNIGDVVTEKAGEGTDTVQSAISLTLASNFENLTLTGTKAINATGNSVANILIGNVGNNVLDGKAGADTMSGGAGNDTYIVDNAGDVVTEKVGEGTDTIQSSISLTLTANVERLTLTGAGDINATGNDLDNVLTGNSGNNSLNGGLGADTMAGGNGSDTYTVDDGADIVTEALNEGDGDTVNATVTYTLMANIETLNLLGDLAIDGTGNDLANVINGNGAANVLDGGLGADTMAAGDGGDTYIVNDTGDTVTENDGQGDDLVRSSVNHALSANVERLTLIGELAINGTGNDLANTLTGNAADNQLDGGAGVDTMIGGAGDDIYFVDSSSDVITEDTGEGTDQVYATISWTLGDNVEKLVLQQFDFENRTVTGTGNELDNFFYGVWNDLGGIIFSGEGGSDTFISVTGNNTLIGGADDDFYIIQFSPNAVITEVAGEGIDTVTSYQSWTLSENVENLTLQTGFVINGTGNAGSNILTGNDSVNRLDGGLGVDTLIGGGGDDTYVLADDTTDILTDSSGKDTISTTISRSLFDYTNIENLTLLGSGNINALGNSVANVLIGNSGNNILYGRGANDTMTGGAGDDEFQFDTYSVPTNAFFGADTIKDFEVGAGDVLKVGPLYDSLAALLAADRIRNDGFGNCSIVLSDDVSVYGSIKLEGVEAEELTEGDFLFG